jgi:hypothetical protein
MNRLLPRRLVALMVSLTILATPFVVTALAAAPVCPSCRPGPWLPWQP